MVFIMICSFQKPELRQLSHQLPFPTDVPLPDMVESEETRYEAFARDNKLDESTRRLYEQAAKVCVFI